MVVDLTVEDDREAPVRRLHRLVPAREIDDAQSTHAEAHGTAAEDAFVIWSAVHDRVAHLFERLCADDRMSIEKKSADNSAHSECLRGREASARRCCTAKDEASDLAAECPC